MSSGRGRSPCDTGPREFRLDVICPGTLAAPSRRNRHSPDCELAQPRDACAFKAHWWPSSEAVQFSACDFEASRERRSTILLFASVPLLPQTNETSLASSSTNAKRRSQRSLFFTGPFVVRHLSSWRHRICQPSLKHFSMYVLSVRTSIAPSALWSASHTAVSSIRFCVVSMALPTSCSVLPSRSINAAHPPRPATPSALQLPSVHTSVFMGRSIHGLAPPRSGVCPRTGTRCGPLGGGQSRGLYP
jgi:hypothetical protein